MRLCSSITLQYFRCSLPSCRMLDVLNSQLFKCDNSHSVTEMSALSSYSDILEAFSLSCDPFLSFSLSCDPFLSFCLLDGVQALSGVLILLSSIHSLSYHCQQYYHCQQSFRCFFFTFCHMDVLPVLLFIFNSFTAMMSFENHP